LEPILGLLIFIGKNREIYIHINEGDYT